MTEKEFIQEVSKQSGITQTKLKECLNAMKPVLLSSLDAGEKLTLRGVCTISVKERKGKIYHHPKSKRYYHSMTSRYIDIVIHKPVKLFLNRKNPSAP